MWDRALERAIAAAIESNNQYRLDYRALKPDGTLVWIHSEGEIIRDDKGKAIKILGTAQDITERKIAEEEMQTALKEKEVLLREIHHRVKNNLAVVSSLLRLQSRYGNDETVRAMFEETETRIRSMALAHAELYQTKNLSEINVRKYFRSLMTNLESSMGCLGENIHVSSEIEDIDLQIDTAIPLGFIVTEFVSNAFKHAFPEGRQGRLNVSLRSLGDQELELVVQDDGVGMPGNPNLRNPKSCGLTLVEVFVKQIDGVLESHTVEGTEMRVRFSIRNTGATLS